MKKAVGARPVKLVPIGNSREFACLRICCRNLVGVTRLFSKRWEKESFCIAKIRTSYPGGKPITPWPLKKKTGATWTRSSPMVLIDGGIPQTILDLFCRPQSHSRWGNPQGAARGGGQPNEMNQFLDTVVVCPLTSTLHPQWRSRIGILCTEKEAEIAVDQIRSISKQRLRRQIDRLSSEAATQLRRLITEMYGE